MLKPNVETSVRNIFGLYAKGRHAEGLALARQLHAAAPQLAVANYCVGHGLAASREPRAALPFLRKASQAEPRNAEFLVRFGKVLLELGRIREAESVLLKAHDLNPSLPVIPWTLGMYYASIDRFDVAAGHFGRVLQSKLPPDAADLARMDWANALIENGQVGKAEEILQEALQRREVRSAALVKLSSIRPFELGSEEYRALLEELGRADLSQHERASLFAAQSRCLKAAGDLEGEYAALQSSKTLRGSNHDIGRFAAHVDAIISAFSPEALQELAQQAGDSSFRPIYVVGLPRSGTTLTEQILSRHDQVGGAGELTIIGDMSRELLDGKPLTDMRQQLTVLTSARLREFRAEVEATMRFLCPGAERIVDKMPHNFLRLGLISVLFPRASFVNCRRHPADNLLSGFKADLNASHAYFHQPDWFIDYYRHYRRMMQHWHAVLPGRIHDLSYEALVTSPREQIASLLSFCDLPWQEECLHPEDSTARIGTASVLQARNPINAGSVGGWKKYAAHLQPVVDALGDG